MGVPEGVLGSSTQAKVESHTHRHTDTHTQTHTHRGVFESDRQAKVGSHTHTSVFMYEPRTTMNTHHFMLQGWDKGQGLGGHGSREGGSG